MARHVTAAGRSRAYLGGAQVPAGACAELTAELVRIYGQSEQERLTEAGRQLQLLDRFAGAAVLEPLSRYSDLWSEDRAAHTALNSVPRPRVEPARSTCCASAWKRSSESDPARRKMSRWRRGRAAAVGRRPAGFGAFGCSGSRGT